MLVSKRGSLAGLVAVLGLAGWLAQGLAASRTPWPGEDREAAARPADREGAARAAGPAGAQAPGASGGPPAPRRDSPASARAALARREAGESRWGTGSEAPPAASASVGPGPRPVGGDGGRVRLTARPEALAAAVTGYDAGAPRPLWLWRIDREEPYVVARAESGVSGRVDFGRVALPDGPLSLAATGVGGDPGVRGPDVLVLASSSSPPPPLAETVESGTGRWRLRLLPQRSSGHVLVSDPAGAGLARLAVPLAGEASRRILTVDLELPPAADHVLVAHEAGDGRRSAWRPVFSTTEEGEQP